MVMVMPMPRFSCPSANFHSRRVLGPEQQKILGEVRAVLTNFCAWERIWVASFSTNFRALEKIRVASFGTSKLDFRVQLNTRRCDSRAGFIQLLASQSRVRKIAAITRVHNGFHGGAEVDEDGDSGEMSSLEDKNSGKEVQIDLQLRRRRLLVEFTCNVCQTRTQRLVNSEAYKRGTVYVQNKEVVTTKVTEITVQLFRRGCRFKLVVKLRGCALVSSYGMGYLIPTAPRGSMSLTHLIAIGIDTWQGAGKIQWRRQGHFRINC